MKIRIRCFHSKQNHFEIDVESTDSVRKLKKIILEILGYPFNPYTDLVLNNSNKIYCRFLNKRLQNGYKLSDYNIQE